MLPPHSALALLPFAIIIGIWVSWSDMKFMKIPNKAVMAMAAVWLVVGVIAVPFPLWLWGWALGATVLVVGFVANAARMIGAGDAKFAAAMAPVFIQADLRLARRVPAVRAATPDWASWTHKDFPMGLALSGSLIFYLLALVWPLF